MSCVCLLDIRVHLCVIVIEIHFYALIISMGSIFRQCGQSDIKASWVHSSMRLGYIHNFTTSCPLVLRSAKMHVTVMPGVNRGNRVCCVLMQKDSSKDQCYIRQK